MYTIAHIFPKYVDGRIWITQFVNYTTAHRPDLRFRVGFAELGMTIGDFHHKGFAIDDNLVGRLQGIEIVRAYIYNASIDDAQLEMLMTRVQRGKATADSKGLSKPRLGTITAVSYKDCDFKQLLSWH